MRLTSVRSLRLAAILVPTTVVSLLAGCSDATAPTEVRAADQSISRARRSVNDGGQCEYGRQSDGSCRSGVTMPWY